MSSLVTSTPVNTPQELRAISSLKMGDHVTAYDPATGKASVQTVQQTMIHHDANLLSVTLRTVSSTSGSTSATSSATAKQREAAVVAHGAHAPPVSADVPTSSHDETIQTTTNHPWLSADHGWILASFLQIGEPVVQVDGATATVVGVQAEPGVASMWDLTVSNVHTFAVGSGAFVVHNCGETLADGTEARITKRGLNHAFSSHAQEWFGRAVTDADRPAFEGAIRQVTRGGADNIFDSSVRNTATRAILGRVADSGRARWMVAHFYTEGPYAGELASAWEPKANELTGFFRALGRLR